MNPLFRTDSYKLSHYLQYPPKAQKVSSYIEARVIEKTVFFGLQAFLKQYLSVPITKADVDDAELFYKAHGVPFNKSGFMRIVNAHNGYWPVQINAVPEGMVMPGYNMQVQVVNTDPALPWVTSFLETALLRAVWYPSTIATMSRRAKEIIYAGLVQTCENPDAEINFKLHDFGARGVSSSESAMLGGMAHLVNFMGTDTVEGAYAAMTYYNSGMPGFSIPATEHSTITAWGRAGEVKAYRHLLEQHPEGLIACVSDSYDIWKATSDLWGSQLRDAVKSRKGTLVVRPDSGDPTIVPLDVIEILMDRFGYTINSKGFRVLDPSVRVIQGDGMNLDSIKTLRDNAIMRGISTENFAMGMGGGLLQKFDRDTLRYAMKASAIQIDGKWQDVYKDPITDCGKKSKRGVLATVHNNDGGTLTIQAQHMNPRKFSSEISRPVWDSGVLLVDDTFDNVRERSRVA